MEDNISQKTKILNCSHTTRDNKCNSLAGLGGFGDPAPDVLAGDAKGAAAADAAAAAAAGAAAVDTNDVGVADEAEAG